MIRIKLNQAYESLPSQSLEELIRSRSISSDNVVILLNSNIIKMGDFSNILLKDGDEVELLDFFTGG